MTKLLCEWLGDNAYTLQQCCMTTDTGLPVHLRKQIANNKKQISYDKIAV